MPVDLNSIKKTDLGALIAGALALLLSVFPAFIKGSVEGDEDFPGLAGGSLGGVTAWNEAAALGMLLVLAATALIAIKVFAPHVLPAGVPVNLIAAGLAGLGTLILVLVVLTNIQSEESFGVKVSFGPGWSGILLLLATIALTAFAALGFKESGEALPWQKQGGTSTGGHASPMGGTQQGTGGYAAPGSGAPTAQQQMAPPPTGQPPSAPPAAGQPPAAPPTSGQQPAGPPPTGQQPAVQPTTPPPGAPMPPPSGGAPMPPPQAPAPGNMPPPGEEQPRTY